MKKLRNEFADTMLEVGRVDPRLVVMVGDISHGILQGFATACPGRYYNIGICEPTIVNMGAGLNKAGLIPVMHTIAPFLTERAFEQIKLDFGYQGFNGTFISVGGAFDYSQLGCSHHCYTDVSLFCHLKRSVVVMPGSPVELNTLFKEAYTGSTINYFRLSETDHGVEIAARDLKVGKGLRMREGGDLTIVAVGPQLRHALAAADTLSGRGVQAEVLYLPTIKPFDTDLVRSSVDKTRRLICVEELSSHGGVFSLCLQACLGIAFQAQQLAIDDFIHGYGSYEELCSRLGLSTEGILKAANSLLHS